MFVWLAVAMSLAADRVDIPVKGGDELTVLPAGETGLVLITQRKGSKKNWEIQGFDTQFEPKWSTNVELAKRFFTDDFDSDQDSAWVLLRKDAKKATVLRTDLDSGENGLIDVRLDKAGGADGLVRADGSGGAWVAINGKKQGMLNWVSPQGGVQSTEVGKKMMVLDLVSTADGAQAALRPFKVKSDTPLTLLNLENGAVATERLVQGSGEELLLTGQAQTVGSRDLVVGTYQPAKAFFGGAQGMYIASFDGAQQTTFATHAFGDFDGFFDWLPSRKEARVEKKVEKKKAKGKTPRIRVNLLVSDAVEVDGGTAIVAESYYPVYHTYTTTQTVSNGQGGTTTVTTTHTVFLGWRFTHAIIAAFDDAGQKLWDHSVPLDTRLTGVVRPHVRLLVEDGSMALIYPYKRTLHRAVIEDGHMVDRGTELSMEDVGSEDAIKNLRGDAMWWFDDSFLVWGTDKVRDEKDKKGRSFWFTRLDGTPDEPLPDGGNVELSADPQ